jgi:hypothetical protein
MRYLTLGEVVELHRRLLQATGGASGIRDFGAWNTVTISATSLLNRSSSGSPRSIFARSTSRSIASSSVASAGNFSIASRTFLDALRLNAIHETIGKLRDEKTSKPTAESSPTGRKLEESFVRTLNGEDEVEPEPSGLTLVELGR